jgi:predicted amidophosphoribosyltransferase
MAKKKPQKKTFKCDRCYVKLKSAMETSVHFKKFPSHRNHRQQIQFDYSQKNRSLRVASGEATRASINDVATIGALPTIQRRMQTVRSGKFCTECGMARKTIHRYCGGCGLKL